MYNTIAIVWTIDDSRNLNRENGPAFNVLTSDEC